MPLSSFFDVRWRILKECTVAKFFASTCPHCSSSDSTMHRFWECHTAIGERGTATQINQQFGTLSTVEALLFPPDPLLSISDTLIWRLHLLALSKAGIYKYGVPPLRAILNALSV